MIDVKFQFPKARLNGRLIEEQAKILADRLQETLIQSVKKTLIQHDKYATKRTHNTIKGKRAGSAKGAYRRQVVGDRGLKFIISGRKPKKKMPPATALAAWFKARGIERHLWFPILRAIALRGIKPLAVGKIAVQESQTTINRLVSMTRGNLSRGLIIVR